MFEENITQNITAEQAERTASGIRANVSRSLDELSGVLGLKQHGLREQVSEGIREADHFAKKRDKLRRLQILMENNPDVVEILDLMRDLRI